MLTDRRTLLTGAAALAATRPAHAQGGGAPIRIGLLHDLSGPFAGAGSVPLHQGAELAIALFNERGGIDGRQVQGVSADSQSRAEVAINEAERLIGQERVDWLKSQNQVVRHSREYLARFKRVMGKRLRRMEKALHKGAP